MMYFETQNGWKLRRKNLKPLVNQGIELARNYAVRNRPPPSFSSSEKVHRGREGRTRRFEQLPMWGGLSSLPNLHRLERVQLPFAPCMRDMHRMYSKSRQLVATKFISSLYSNTCFSTKAAGMADADSIYGVRADNDCVGV